MERLSAFFEESLGNNNASPGNDSSASLYDPFSPSQSPDLDDLVERRPRADPQGSPASSIHTTSEPSCTHRRNHTLPERIKTRLETRKDCVSPPPADFGPLNPSPSFTCFMPEVRFRQFKAKARTGDQIVCELKEETISHGFRVDVIGWKADFLHSRLWDLGIKGWIATKDVPRAMRDKVRPGNFVVAELLSAQDLETRRAVFLTLISKDPARALGLVESVIEVALLYRLDLRYSDDVDYERLLETELNSRRPQHWDALRRALKLPKITSSFFDVQSVPTANEVSERLASIRRRQKMRTIDDLVFRASRASDGGAFTEAISLLSDAIRLDPDHPGVHTARGLLYAATGNFDDAICDLWAGVEQDLENVQKRDFLLKTLLTFGRKHLTDGDFGRARTVLEACVAFDPTAEGVQDFQRMVAQAENLPEKMAALPANVKKSKADSSGSKTSKPKPSKLRIHLKHNSSKAKATLLQKSPLEKSLASDDDSPLETPHNTNPMKVAEIIDLEKQEKVSVSHVESSLPEISPLPLVSDEIEVPSASLLVKPVPEVVPTNVVPPLPVIAPQQPFPEPPVVVPDMTRPPPMLMPVPPYLGFPTRSARAQVDEELDAWKYKTEALLSHIAMRNASERIKTRPKCSESKDRDRRRRSRSPPVYTVNNRPVSLRRNRHERSPIRRSRSKSRSRSKRRSRDRGSSRSPGRRRDTSSPRGRRVSRSRSRSRSTVIQRCRHSSESSSGKRERDDSSKRGRVNNDAVEGRRGESPLAVRPSMLEIFTSVVKDGIMDKVKNLPEPVPSFKITASSGGRVVEGGLAKSLEVTVARRISPTRDGSVRVTVPGGAGNRVSPQKDDRRSPENSDGDPWSRKHSRRMDRDGKIVRSNSPDRVDVSMEKGDRGEFDLRQVLRNTAARRSEENLSEVLEKAEVHFSNSDLRMILNEAEKKLEAEQASDGDVVAGRGGDDMTSGKGKLGTVDLRHVLNSVESRDSCGRADDDADGRRDLRQVLECNRGKRHKDDGRRTPDSRGWSSARATGRDAERLSTNRDGCDVGRVLDGRKSADRGGSRSSDVDSCLKHRVRDRSQDHEERREDRDSSKVVDSRRVRADRRRDASEDRRVEMTEHQDVKPVLSDLRRNLRVCNRSEERGQKGRGDRDSSKPSGSSHSDGIRGRQGTSSPDNQLRKREGDRGKSKEPESRRRSIDREDRGKSRGPVSRSSKDREDRGGSRGPESRRKSRDREHEGKSRRPQDGCARGGAQSGNGGESTSSEIMEKSRKPEDRSREGGLGEQGRSRGPGNRGASRESDSSRLSRRRASRDRQIPKFSSRFRGGSRDRSPGRRGRKLENVDSERRGERDWSRDDRCRGLSPGRDGNRRENEKLGSEDAMRRGGGERNRDERRRDTSPDRDGSGSGGRKLEDADTARRGGGNRNRDQLRRDPSPSRNGSRPDSGHLEDRARREDGDRNRDHLRRDSSRGRDGSRTDDRRKPEDVDTARLEEGDRNRDRRRDPSSPRDGGRREGRNPETAETRREEDRNRDDRRRDFSPSRFGTRREGGKPQDLDAPGRGEGDRNRGDDRRRDSSPRRCGIRRESLNREDVNANKGVEGDRLRDDRRRDSSPRRFGIRHGSEKRDDLDARRRVEDDRNRGHRRDSTSTRDVHRRDPSSSRDYRRRNPSLARDSSLSRDVRRRDPSVSRDDRRQNASLSRNDRRREPSLSRDDDRRKASLSRNDRRRDSSTPGDVRRRDPSPSRNVVRRVSRDVSRPSDNEVARRIRASDDRGRVSPVRADRGHDRDRNTRTSPPRRSPVTFPEHVRAPDCDRRMERDRSPWGNRRSRERDERPSSDRCRGEDRQRLRSRSATRTTTAAGRGCPRTTAARGQKRKAAAVGVPPDVDVAEVLCRLELMFAALKEDFVSRMRNDPSSSSSAPAPAVEFNGVNFREVDDADEVNKLRALEAEIGRLRAAQAARASRGANLPTRPPLAPELMSALHTLGRYELERGHRLTLHHFTAFKLWRNFDPVAADSAPGEETEVGAENDSGLNDGMAAGGSTSQKENPRIRKPREDPLSRKEKDPLPAEERLYAEKTGSGSSSARSNALAVEKDGGKRAGEKGPPSEKSEDGSSSVPMDEKQKEGTRSTTTTTTKKDENRQLTEKPEVTGVSGSNEESSGRKRLLRESSSAPKQKDMVFGKAGDTRQSQHDTAEKPSTRKPEDDEPVEQKEDADNVEVLPFKEEIAVSNDGKQTDRKRKQGEGGSSDSKKRKDSRGSWTPRTENRVPPTGNVEEPEVVVPAVVCSTVPCLEFSAFEEDVVAAADSGRVAEAVEDVTCLSQGRPDVDDNDTAFVAESTPPPPDLKNPSCSFDVKQERVDDDDEIGLPGLSDQEAVSPHSFDREDVKLNDLVEEMLLSSPSLGDGDDEDDDDVLSLGEEDDGDAARRAPLLVLVNGSEVSHLRRPESPSAYTVDVDPAGASTSRGRRRLREEQQQQRAVDEDDPISLSSLEALSDVADSTLEGFSPAPQGVNLDPGAVGAICTHFSTLSSNLSFVAAAATSDVSDDDGISPVLQLMDSDESAADGSPVPDPQFALIKVEVPEPVKEECEDSADDGNYELAADVDFSDRVKIEDDDDDDFVGFGEDFIVVDEAVDEETG